jgi:hypothetical protein
MGDLESADRFIERAVNSLRDRDITGISEVHSHLGVIRAAQGRDADAETAFRLSLEEVMGTEYAWPQIDAAIDLATFLAERGRMDEATALTDEYSGLAQQRGWKVWDPKIADLRRLIANHQPI